jgi:hypothetical protein
MLLAARSFGNVLQVLADIPDDAIVTQGAGVTATALKKLARMHLEPGSDADAAIAAYPAKTRASGAGSEAS